MLPALLRLPAQSGGFLRLKGLSWDNLQPNLSVTSAAVACLLDSNPRHLIVAERFVRQPLP